MVPTLTVEPNQLITQSPQVSQEGKVFAGWYLDEAYTELFDFGFNKVNEDMTLHAKWKIQQITMKPLRFYLLVIVSLKMHIDTYMRLLNLWYS